MEKIDILLWIVGGGFTLNFGLMLLMWQSIGKIDDKLNSVDKRLVAVETLLHMKECCMLKEEKQHKKAV